MRPAPHYAEQSHYSDPRGHSALFEAIDPDIAVVSAVARNVVVHYRSSGFTLPPSTNDDINARWIDRILDLDQQRHGVPLTDPRPAVERVQGCCRDHSLLCLGMLRHHGIPARSRVGFADYLRPDSRVDHVVVEAWLNGRWVRFDPELTGPGGRVRHPHDIPIGDESPFTTAATAWIAHRQRGESIEDLGVPIPEGTFGGEPFVLTYLIMDVAHRFGDELLLWDSWGAMPEPDGNSCDVTLGDLLAELLDRADSGDAGAEEELRQFHREDSRTRPGASVTQFSPRGDAPVTVLITR